MYETWGVAEVLVFSSNAELNVADQLHPTHKAHTWHLGLSV